MIRLYNKWTRARSERERLESAAERATITIVRDGKGRVIAAC